MGSQYGVGVLKPPAQIAVLAATHSNPELRLLWQSATKTLAQVNPSILRRVANQMRTNQPESSDAAKVAQQIEEMMAG